VERYEAGQPTPWRLEVGSAFNQKLIRAVVAFRIEISRIEGKWKLSQNHGEERREKVMAALGASADAEAREVAAMMREAVKRGEREP
jgi:transcriptional regulator